jgi:hypothetical protein
MAARTRAEKPGSPGVDLLGKAQDLIYPSEVPNLRRRLALAKKALALSPDCSGAYVLLAEAPLPGSPERSMPKNLSS